MEGVNHAKIGAKMAIKWNLSEKIVNIIKYHDNPLASPDDTIWGIGFFECEAIQNIKNSGMKAGVALNPHSSIHLLEDIISDIDLVCVMSVNPGFGGQKFIENTFTKVAALKKLITEKNSKALIEIDGGVDLNNYKKLVSVGADVLVAGNTVFGSANPTQTITQLKQI